MISPARRVAATIACVAVLGGSSVSMAITASNLHGQLFLHGRPDLEYTSVGDPAGESDLDDCHSALTILPESEDVLIWYVMAAFPPEISPRVTGVQFGIKYDESRITIADFGFTDDAAVYRTDNYPDSEASVRVYFAEARTERLFEIGWLGGFSSQPRALFEFDTAFPNLFWDDFASTPVESYGSLGFGVEGEFVCSPTFACCLPDGTCAVLSDFTCEERSGILFDNPTCSPDPCLGVVGACCIPEEPARCAIQTKAECDSADGIFIGIDTVCPPSACVLGVCCLDELNPEKCEVLLGATCIALGGAHVPGQTGPNVCMEFCCCGPTVETSWGTIKSRFR